MTNFGKLVGTLADAAVEFIAIGGVALVSRGGSRRTVEVQFDRLARTPSR